MIDSRIARGLAGLVACAALAGCASMPARDERVTAEVSLLAPSRVALMSARQRAEIEAAGITPSEVAAGRLVRVACAVMTDGWWSGLAVLPPGMNVADRDVVQVRVKDPGTNDYDGINEVVKHVAPPLAAGRQAYRAIPDWRERGLRNNFERVELPPEARGRYLVVQGSYLVKCR